MKMGLGPSSIALLQRRMQCSFGYDCRAGDRATLSEKLMQSKRPNLHGKEEKRRAESEIQLFNLLGFGYDAVVRVCMKEAKGTVTLVVIVQSSCRDPKWATYFLSINILYVAAITAHHRDSQEKFIHILSPKLSSHGNYFHPARGNNTDDGAYASTASDSY